MVVGELKVVVTGGSRGGQDDKEDGSGWGISYPFF